jgi:hypothetical protein
MGEEDVRRAAVPTVRRTNLSHQDVVDAEGIVATALAHLRLERRQHARRELVAERLGTAVAWQGFCCIPRLFRCKNIWREL